MPDGSVTVDSLGRQRPGRPLIPTFPTTTPAAGKRSKENYFAAWRPPTEPHGDPPTPATSSPPPSAQPLEDIATAVHKHAPLNAPRNDVAAMAGFDSAIAAAGMGNWPLCAHGYMTAFVRATPEWPYRYNCLSGFCSVLRENTFPASPAQLALLARLGEAASEPILVRVQALFTLAFLKGQAGDDAGARQGYAAVTEAASKAAPAELGALVTLPDGRGAYGDTPVSDVLEGLLHYARQNQAQPPAEDDQQQHAHTPQERAQEAALESHAHSPQPEAPQPEAMPRQAEPEEAKPQAAAADSASAGEFGVIGGPRVKGVPRGFNDRP